MKNEVHHGHAKKMHKGKKVAYILAVLLLMTLALALYLTFVQPNSCASFECFQGKMRSCDRIKHLNEGSEASWEYEIKGRRGENCRINVKLLQAKQGDLGIQKLEGLGMECSYPLGLTAYPESDLNKCHGQLKEEMLTIQINKLHSYILDNLGEIEEGLAGTSIKV